MLIIRCTANHRAESGVTPHDTHKYGFPAAITGLWNIDTHTHTHTHTHTVSEIRHVENNLVRPRK